MLSARRAESEDIMTALYHFYEIIRTKRTVKREWIFCGVFDEQTANERLIELRKNNPNKVFTYDKIK